MFTCRPIGFASQINCFFECHVDCFRGYAQHIHILEVYESFRCAPFIPRDIGLYLFIMNPSIYHIFLTFEVYIVSYTIFLSPDTCTESTYKFSLSVVPIGFIYNNLFL